MHWDPSPGAASYSVYRSLVSGQTAFLINKITTSHLSTNLVNGTKYYYQVTAVGPGGESAKSAEITATPAAIVPPPPPPPGAHLDHLVLVVLENKSYAEIIGPAPWLTALSKQGASATNFFAIAHPSLPDYLALLAGKDFANSHDDAAPSAHSYGDKNLVDLLETAGVSWGGYMESMGTTPNRQTNNGDYAVRHNPFAYFTDITGNPTRNAKVVDFSNLKPTALPTFTWITPNVANDMHNGTVAQGDAWCALHLQPILDAMTGTNSLMAITFDEDDGSQSNKVACIFAGPKAKAGASSAVHYTLYSLLRTIESLLGLGSLGTGDAAAAVMSDMLA